MDVAYHFKCYEDRNYAIFPENFILQSLKVCGMPTVSHIYKGDILYAYTRSNLSDAISERDFIKTWLKDAELQTKDVLELVTSYVVRFSSITKEADAILHLSLAQTEPYLGKILVERSLIHTMLYTASLVCFGQLDTTKNEIALNISEFDYEHAGDHQRYKEFEDFGYKVCTTKQKEP